MPTPVKFPRLGESVAEGTVAAWLKREGDYVEKDEALAEVVTDKVNAELPSPVAGRLVKILVPADQTVPVGTAIALIEEEGAVAEVAEEASASQSSRAAAALATPAVEQVTSAAAVQRGTSALSVEAEAVTAEPHDGQQPGERERQRISPLARRLAREHGIDLNEIKGTGIGGRVRKEDILAYLDQRQRSAQTAQVPAAAVAAQPRPSSVTVASSAAVAARGPEPVAAGPDEEVIVPDRMRLAIAEHMVRSKRTAPHATTVVEVDMTAIARWLERNKEEFKRREGYSISYVPFVMKAVCEGIRKVPLINSSWTEDNRIIVKKRIHLGVAVATDSGLVVPTIHDADQYTIAGLARRLNEVAQRARSNRLTVQDLQGSTFVVNNPGTFGTILSVPIINQPHAAILSMDAVVKRPVVTEEDAIAIRYMMYLCLSFDHRILDGAGAATFLQAVRAKLQSYGSEIDVY
ncbi:MAG: 2-oxo acid dehydrogenase subunit E2 [Thermogemmatispora sp.]|jgi:pyruvate/2-oxoglutarate dehydrogenase complex dihydrolipoamide acyltransferase (E2) component|uniref:Dihydrolipoamide acetyltransferase component of pyruvate dehydrogenase complex n=1 Tax=Thermogemmatispora aurantia TaxID=2045279 RepID=A0A5J4K613_9CHLR|nr:MULTISPECIES: dihydrolipoamide acetyltransferase family protein [Thermogemmatispora]MBE3564579.1 2-oxo acid dehydrogenase subunit E2 [Thermogemmatispora sp.]GER82119.1 dihydrolipoamide acetyltransferase component of pyruvate dehydrogenase complex [Thermogemmatispora aurantia]